MRGNMAKIFFIFTLNHSWCTLTPSLGFGRDLEMRTPSSISRFTCRYCWAQLPGVWVVLELLKWARAISASFGVKPWLSRKWTIPENPSLYFPHLTERTWLKFVIFFWYSNEKPGGVGTKYSKERVSERKNKKPSPQASKPVSLVNL